MPDFIGVKAWSVRDQLTSVANLKRDALIFKRIAIPCCSNLLNNFRRVENESSKEVIAELEWLLDNAVIFEPEGITEDIRLKNKEIFTDVKLACERILKIEYPSDNGQIEKGYLDSVIRELDTSIAYLMRATASRLRLVDGLDAHPILLSGQHLSNNIEITKSEVAQIALKTLPIPDEATSWEQILEYRSDAASFDKFLDLRHWMSEVVRAKLTPLEVEQKLEHLISRYQRHMQLHKMKTNTGTLETIVTTSAEMLGDLLSFKWGKAAQALFSLKRRQVALLEGELTVPGNEVAYIVKARETFKGE
jgi:hypothetical protein